MIMSARNFCFENRCVVLDDEQWEDVRNGYTEIELGDARTGYRNFPSYWIELSPDLETFIMKPVITSGYYENACIDYVDTGKSVSEVIYGSNSYRLGICDDMIFGIEETWGCAIAQFCADTLNRLRRDFPELDDEDMFWMFDDKATEIVKRHESYVLNGIIDRWKDEMYITEDEGKVVYQAI